MNRIVVRIKEFLKSCPLTAKLYEKVRLAIMAPHGEALTEVQESRPVHVAPEQAAASLRLNFVVPSVDRQHVFGGVSTALKFFETLRKTCGCPARILVTDAPVTEKTSVPLDGYAFNDSGAALQVVSLFDREQQLPVHEHDVFVATAWWTAYVAADIIRWQAERFGGKLAPLVYMVQDYEPGFYPWSSQYVMAESTYRLEMPTYAVINSTELAAYFKAHDYSFTKSWVFDPVLNDSLREHFPGVGRDIPKKKQILVYGRPSVNRNAFEVVVSALRRWRAQQAGADAWTVLSAGEMHDEVDLGGGVTLRSVGKLSLEEYAKTLMDSYAGISLMVSPHPSYPPLEMAAFGVRTITNRYANKDLSGFSGNIVSLQSCDPRSVADALTVICDGFNGVGRSDADSRYVSGRAPFDGIAGDICEALKQYGC